MFQGPEPRRVSTMERIVLEHQHSEMIPASWDPATRQVVFEGKVVTGKMYVVLPATYYVEIFEQDGKYYLYPAA
jgi:hypothetical protein